MKKLFVVLLTALMVLGLAGCQGSSNNTGATTSTGKVFYLFPIHFTQSKRLIIM